MKLVQTKKNNKKSKQTKVNSKTFKGIAVKKVAIK